MLLREAILNEIKTERKTVRVQILAAVKCT